MKARLDRRDVVVGSSALALLAAGFGPRALAGTDHFEEALAGFLAERRVARDGITIDAPEVAENGNMVPVTIAIDSPMTEADHVDEVVLLSTRNPVAEIARFHFTPACGRGFVSTRVRLAESQEVVAVAVMSDGSLRQATRQIRVTIGGCGS